MTYNVLSTNINMRFRMISPLNTQIMSILFKIQSFSAKSIEKYDDRIVITAERNIPHCCPKCGNTCDKKKDSTTQEILIGSLLGCAIYCRIKVYRVICLNCGVKTEKNDISSGKRRFSKAVSEEVIRYTELLDNKSTGILLGLSQSTVYRIDKECLSSLFEKYKNYIPSAERISIDEYAKRKGHDYATSLVDYDTGKVLWVEKGRKAEDLERAYDEISYSLTNVKQVSLDLWPAYEKATINKLPKAKMVYDRFHISRLLNRAVEEERREYQNQLSDEERKRMKKHSRWILLKRKSNLTTGNKLHLEELKKQNATLYEVYLLKEDFLSVFEIGKSPAQAKNEIIDWTNIIFKSNYNKLKKFARSILRRLNNLINWFEYPISNGKTEGINNKIKTVMRRAYGYKDFVYMRLKVLQKCGLLMNMRFHTF